MRLTKIFRDFFNSERSGGISLIFVTIISLIIANSPWQEHFISFWDNEVGGHTLVHWINDLLMAVFFLLIGLELEREIYQGEISDIRRATLPIFGAIGGMLVPALIFMAINFGLPTQKGSGIPTATDIAFAVGILSLLGNRVPASLKVFLIALAIMDDLGAIIVIAIFYTGSIIYFNLLIALGIFAILIVLNRLKIHALIPYVIGGILMWYFMLHSGVHPTITGVMLAFAMPFGNGRKKTLSYRVQHALHIPVAFIILPLFALSNTAIAFGSDWYQGLLDANSIGIIIGLVFGKPIGILLFALLGVGIGLCKLPSDLKWINIFGVGILAGIGFTMSIFITLLAYDDPTLIVNSKIAILAASAIAGMLGFIVLRGTLKIKLDKKEAITIKE